MFATYSCPETERSFVVDETVYLWACRMCVGEGGRDCSPEKVAAMMWALTHRYLFWPRMGRTFLGLMRAFSQPINPRWARGGDLARKWAGTKFASAAKLKRRAKIQSMGIKKIRREIRSMVLAFARGLVPLPEAFGRLEYRRVSNWASLGSTKHKHPWGCSVGDDDWFFEDKDPKLLSGHVEVIHG